MFNIRDFHDEVVQFLLDYREKEKDLRFLIECDKYSTEGGYHWIGNSELDDSIDIRIQFWSVFYVYFSIFSNDNLTECSLEIIPNHYFEITDFIMAKTNVQVIKKIDHLWGSKKYKRNTWHEALTHFLETDKKIIDTIVANAIENKDDTEDLGFIEKSEFEKELALLLKASKRKLHFIGKTQKKFHALSLQKLHLQHIGHFDDIELDLSKRVICLVGENGCGKSTILKAIALALVGVTNQIDTKNKAIQSLLQIVRTHDKKLEYASKGNIVLTYFWGKDSKNEIILEKEAFNGIKVENVVESDNNFSFNDSKDANFLQVLMLGFPQGSGKTPSLKYISPPDEPNVYDILPLILETQDNRFEKCKEWIDTQYKLHLQERESKTSTTIYLENIELLFRIISQITSGRENELAISFKDISYSDSLPARIDVCTPENPDGIPFDMLSTGLNNLFSWIGHFIGRLTQSNSSIHQTALLCQEAAIVLIDEIDNYLHPKVQVHILPVLMEAFPNTTFILTSHSPILLTTLDNTQSIAYQVDKKEITPILHYYGKRIQDVMYQEYGIQERPAKEIKDKIMLLFEKIYAEDKEGIEQLKQELSPILGEEDPAILEAKLILEDL